MPAPRALPWAGWQRGVKRTIDVVGSAVALIVLSPLLLVVAALVRWRLGAPVLFAQPRLGYRGRSFTILKFRTMTDERGADGRPLPDEQRLTALGRFLRRSSIDELPELVNVLKGDMSLVGPRPLITAYLQRYTAEQARRMAMPPGVTGLAQISGRNALTWDERFRLDVEYVDRWNLGLDLAIIVRTVLAVLRRQGISAEGHATMTEFLGSKAEGSEVEGSGSGGREPRPPHTGSRRAQEGRHGST